MINALECSALVVHVCSLFEYTIISMVVTLLTHLHQLLLTLKTLFIFLTKQGNLTRRSTALSHPVQLVFLAQGYRQMLNDNGP